MLFPDPLGPITLTTSPGRICSLIPLSTSSFPTLIARIKDKRQRRELLAEAIEKGLSLAEIKQRIQEMTQVISPPSLKKRMQSVTKKLYASKCWDDPKKQKKLEKLLSEIESLL